MIKVINPNPEEKRQVPFFFDTIEEAEDFLMDCQLSNDWYKNRYSHYIIVDMREETNYDSNGYLLDPLESFDLSFHTPYQV